MLSIIRGLLGWKSGRMGFLAVGMLLHFCLCLSCCRYVSRLYARCVVVCATFQIIHIHMCLAVDKLICKGGF